jgi:hypothetical protein
MLLDCEQQSNCQKNVFVKQSMSSSSSVQLLLLFLWHHLCLGCGEYMADHQLDLDFWL